MGLRHLTLALAMLATQTMATTVQFNNRCGHAIDLIKTVPSVAGTQECDLQPGASCTKNYDGPGFNFKHTNAGKSVTQAEFTFNDAAQKDFYNLSVVDGFNVAIQITSDKGGPTLTCNADKCPDAYNFPSDDTKVHAVPTGGTFQINFC